MICFNTTLTIYYANYINYFNYIYICLTLKSKTPNWWVVTHEEHGIVIRFEEGAFN